MVFMLKRKLFKQYEHQNDIYYSPKCPSLQTLKNLIPKYRIGIPMVSLFRRSSLMMEAVLAAVLPFPFHSSSARPHLLLYIGLRFHKPHNDIACQAGSLLISFFVDLNGLAATMNSALPAPCNYELYSAFFADIFFPYFIWHVTYSLFDSKYIHKKHILFSLD